MSAQLVTATRVLTPDRVLEPGWVEWRGERLTAVGAGAPPRPADLDLGSSTVAPGLVDIHAHGGGGASFQDGPEAAEQVVACHRRHGTTTMVASLVTGAVPELERDVAALAGLVDAGVLAGLHLEGPWLSPAMAGVHDPGHLRPPDPATVDRLLEAGGGAVRMVTLAPELEGGLDAVRRLVSAGVVAAVGHTDATYDVTRAALDAGARVGTHLHNAMRRHHHREPGPAAALLDDAEAFVELIADGVHLHPAVLRAATRTDATPVLVTDAMAAAGAGDGDYRLGGQSVRVRDGVARLAEGGAIAGSTLTLAAALRFAVIEAGVSLVEAVRAATAAPAGVLGRDDVGRLVPGARADLVVLDDDLRVSGVLEAGSWQRS